MRDLSVEDLCILRAARDHRLYRDKSSYRWKILDAHAPDRNEASPNRPAREALTGLGLIDLSFPERHSGDPLRLILTDAGRHMLAVLDGVKA